MTLEEAIAERHSVRSFNDTPIAPEAVKELEREIEKCNAEGGVSLRLVTDDPSVFNSLLARYGKFRNVSNCIIVAAPSGLKDAERLCGYYGERVVLLAQTLGLRSCWAGLTFSKKSARKYTAEGDKLLAAIALGHSDTDGKPHKSKSYADVCSVANPPEWFRKGVDAALLAPTALNRQDFRISADAEGNPVITAASGKYPQMDAGIAECHFKIAADAARKA